ncbi:MAG: GDSL-type esterase/lipase family protein [Chitinophagaceae bacterium]
MKSRGFLFVVFSMCIMFTHAQTAPPFWNDILRFKKLDSMQPPPANAILLTGSSSFTRWTDVNNYFPGYTIINRAFGGSTLPDVIRYAYDAIIPYKPKQVLIYCGENDLASADSISAAEVLKRVQTLFSIIRINLPGTTITYVSIKPSPVRAGIQIKVKAANELIKAFFSKQANASFIDIYRDMLDANGNMREEIFVGDRLHMNATGYAIWQRKIKPYLKK